VRAYVDVGAFRGSTIRRFRVSSRYSPDCKIFAFECNPKLANIDYGSDVTTIRKAAWVSDGELKFYLSRRNADKVEGSSVYKEKITGNLDPSNPVTVQTLNFSRWLADTFQYGDTVIVKMNIEGAEYDILPVCIADGTINMISEIHIQWHFMKIGMSRNDHDKIIRQLRETKIKMFSGYGNLK